MSAKDKDTKRFHDRFKELFKRNKAQIDINNVSGRGEYKLSADRIRDVSKESSTSTRLRALKELSEIVASHKLEDNAVEKLWHTIQDLFNREHANETRHTAFHFLQSLIKGQNEKILTMRAQFFRFIKTHDHPDDICQRLELLNCLTSNGKFILYFEEEVGAFLLHWLPEISRAGKIQDHLSMLDNVIKYNAAYLDDDVIGGFIQHIYVLCCSATNYETVMLCLQVMLSIVAYSNMSPDSIPKFIAALCSTVVVESYCHESWRIMKNLLGTHMGHAALYTMCKILQEPQLKLQIDLLRGSVFFIRMALWGQQACTTLYCPANSVLPSYLHAVKRQQASVTYEVMLGVQQLICRHRKELQDPTWMIVFQIMEQVIRQIEKDPGKKPNSLIVDPLHDTLNLIESWIGQNQFNCGTVQFYALIESCAASRPEASVLKLIGYLAESIVPTDPAWQNKLQDLIHKYFKVEVRTNIRLKVLDILSEIIKLNRLQHEDVLIDEIVILNMSNIVSDNDVIVRASVAKLLVDLCLNCTNKRCLELLDICEKMLKRPFDPQYAADTIPTNESEFCDLKSLVSGLINAFTYKIHKLPSTHALKIYRMLLNFLEMHYSKPKVFENCNQIRYMIFDYFLKMRADRLYHLGCPTSDKNTLKFSSYILISYRNMEQRPSLGSPAPSAQQSSTTVSYISLRRTFKLVLTCLKYERDWQVLNLILQEMPNVLQNKSLILSKQGNNELDVFVDVLCALISDRTLNLPESLNVKVNKQDFHSSVLLVLVSLASFHTCLDPPHQQKMIRCLMKCIQIGPRCTKQCIGALTICTLEMREVMVKLMSDVLLILSKISATVLIAVPVLEFLSTLSQLPMVFANFVADQYMAVFAISLPYTNPFKYNHYTVSLAHHVIAVWFLKCRLPFRSEFVKFITKGLQTNVLVNFEESSIPNTNMDLGGMNQDSTDRKRSSSLTEQGSRRRAAGVSRIENKPAVVNLTQPPKQHDKFHVLRTFYEELTETCIDLMARYAFSPCSALPRRLATADFLLNGGQSMCWVIGNKIVTVTTSGCSQKILKHGLCDKCWTLCNAINRNENKLSKTRSGSNEKYDTSSVVTRQNSQDNASNTNSPVTLEENVIPSFKAAPQVEGKFEDLISTKLQQLALHDEKAVHNCACWCQGWAEIHVRRPTGDMSWVMRIQNQINQDFEFPISDISTLFMPTLNQELRQFNYYSQQTSEESNNANVETAEIEESSSVPASPNKSASRQSSREEDDDEYTIYDDGTKSRNPVRRSNSSPEMSANWKNPFLVQKSVDESEASDANDDNSGQSKKTKMYSKDMRVSCEAIPEEIAGMGTTPPSSDPVQMSEASEHPSLLSCHSYPGVEPQKYSARTSQSKTVPQSPNDFQQQRRLNYISAKPPQSPTQTRHEIKKSSSSSVIERTMSANRNLNLAREVARDRRNNGGLEADSNQAQQQRDRRTHTISVMSPASRKPRLEQKTRSKETPKSGINPSFIFLQLYHAATFGTVNERPLLVSSSDIVQRAVKILDSIPPYEMHKIGVLYVREGQSNNEVEILKNRFGSVRYVNFLQSLGTLVRLADVEQLFFLGGLEQNGTDGKFTYVWQDDVISVTFQVATLMPNKESDPNCNNKKLHIGNNYVTIVYNESEDDFNINTIKSQFNFASIIIQPLDHNTNRVTVKVKHELTDLITVGEPRIVSDENVAILAKQLALHADLASLMVCSLKRSPNPYASNWLERLRKIKNVRNKVILDNKNNNKDENSYPSDEANKKILMEDFTVYT